MRPLFGNIRFFVLLFSCVVGIGVYAVVVGTGPLGNLEISRLTSTYALIAAGFLYVALLISPLYAVFSKLPFRGRMVVARRAIGVSAFAFAFLHAFLAFFKQLGGFAGLPFLGPTYLTAVLLGLFNLIILSLLAATSFDGMMRRLGKRWKVLHRAIYLVGCLVVIHALLIGSHYTNLSSGIGWLSFLLVAGLLILQGLRIDKGLRKRQSSLPQCGMVTLLVIILIAFAYPYTQNTSSGSINIHSQHIQVAKEAQQSTTLSTKGLALPGLQGDRTKRYNVQFDHGTVIPGQATTLRFTVTDAATGTSVSAFSKVYEKFLHLIITNSTLTSFEHVHPEFKNGGFEITHTFTETSLYRLYMDFQPFGAIEQAFGFSLSVGTTELSPSTQVAQTDPVSTVNGYRVTMDSSEVLRAEKLSVGGQEISFNVQTVSGEPVTNLRPYLSSFGHVVMINQQTYEYLHMHPSNLKTLLPDDRSGPEVTFLPLGLYGAIKPGVYRIFAQFNPESGLIVADFTITIQ